VTFKPHIGATDALRTGSYGKTLTFHALHGEPNSQKRGEPHLILGRALPGRLLREEVIKLCESAACLTELETV
jgi:hypothetical protein